MHDFTVYIIVRKNKGTNFKAPGKLASCLFYAPGVNLRAGEEREEWRVLIGFQKPG